MPKGWVALFTAGWFLASPATARAQDDKAAARELFRAGELAFSRNEFRAAAIAFEAAHEKSASGGALYNAGVAWTRASEPARAADAFESALASGTLPESQLADARSRLAALEQKLGVLIVSGPSDASFTVGHLSEVRPPLRLHLRSGQHVVRLRFPDGEREARVIRIFPAGVTKLTVDAPAPAEPGETPRRERPRAPARGSAEADGRGDPTLGWVLVGSGAVSAAAGVVLLTRGLSARDAFERSGRTDANEHDRAISYRTWSTVALFGGAALAGAGTVLLLTGKPDASAPRVSLAVGAGSVAFVGRGL